MYSVTTAQRICVSVKCGKMPASEPGAGEEEPQGELGGTSWPLGFD